MRFAVFGILCVFATSSLLPAQSTSSTPSAPGATQVAQQFKRPATKFRPMVRWWWPGGDVTNAELRHEIDLMDQAGLGGAEIQPFSLALSPRMSVAARQKVNDYLTPTFFGHVGAAIEEARSHGMWLDFTFGSGWPFGGAGVVTPELASVELASTHQTIRGPVHFHGKIPMPQLPASIANNTSLPSDWEQRFKDREKLVAVVAWRGSSVQYFPSQAANARPAVKTTGQLDPGTAVVLTKHMEPDGTLDWNVPPGVWQVFAFKEMPTGQRVVGGVGGGPQFVLDHMDRTAFDAYAQRVGGTLRQSDGKFFGDGLRAIFCDSLEVFANLYWDNDFLQQFRKLRGYDLTPYLPLVKIPGFGLPYGATAARLPLYNLKGIGNQKDIDSKVRRDYWQTVSDVMNDNFYRPFDQWASENHLLSRVQAHGSPTDLLRVYGEASIPETEDLYDNGRYDFLKMASSAGDLYGRKIVSSESFVWKGKIYQTTPEKIKRFADELITAGINEIIYHGYPYQLMDRPFPGWDPFATGGAFSSDVNRTNPFTPYFPRLNGYITRLQYLSQTGTTVVPVALYRGGLAYEDIEPAPPEPAIDTRLMDAGYNFDHIDASVLLQCHVADGKLVSSGGARYSALVLPKQKAVSGAVAKQLIRFAHQGLPIVFLGRVPNVMEEKIVNGQLQGVSVTDPLHEVLSVSNVHTTHNPADTVTALEAAGVQPNLHFDGSPVPFIEKRIGKLDIFFFRNPGDAPQPVQIKFQTKGTPEIWDPWTGEIHSLPFQRQGTDTQIHLDLNGYGSKLVVFNPAAGPASIPAPIAARRVLTQIAIGQAGWKFHGVGIGPGSQPETIDQKMPKLIDWSAENRLKNFSGRGTYTTTFRLPAVDRKGDRRIILDLGDVKDVAQVSINGKPGPVLLVRPYKADVTTWVHTGENSLQITVINTLYNALSAQGPSAVYVPEDTITANGKMPSGLIGPVRIEETAP